MSRGLGPLPEQARTLVQSARRTAAVNINTLQVLTNFGIGRLIVEHGQQGQDRATYGKETLKRLAVSLTAEFGRGFSERNLQYMRKFFLIWKERAPQISQKPSAKLPPSMMAQPPSGTLPVPFTLSWSHYVVLLGIRSEQEHRFYEVESAQSEWSVQELKRQVNSSLYELLALSRDKTRVRRLAAEGHIATKPSDMLKDPYILEFLGLEDKPTYSETDLESAIIGKLQQFLLELGKGFLFEARQKRFTFDDDHFSLDLVFYNPAAAMLCLA